MPSQFLSILPLILLSPELPDFEKMIVQGEQIEWHDFREMTIVGAAFAAGIPVGMWKETSHIPTSYKPLAPNLSSSNGR